MQIIHGRRISESQWRHAPDGELADAQSTEPPGAIIVALSAWRARRQAHAAIGSR